MLDHILAQLKDVRERCPELRFGQLIAIIGALAADKTRHSLWDVEDAEFAAALERFAADMAHRGAGSSASAAFPKTTVKPCAESAGQQSAR
ncbi:MAG: hypothetical protein FJ271_13410 [Planctomycetes bacterium]|nr:hypothetical protein [Planctomycetota bacterium]